MEVTHGLTIYGIGVPYLLLQTSWIGSWSLEPHQFLTRKKKKKTLHFSKASYWHQKE
jgi:hypothetical protein